MPTTAVRERTGARGNGASPTATTAPAAPPITEMPTFTKKGQALRWLDQQARRMGVDEERLQEIKSWGQCKDQVDQRLDALCEAVGIPRRELGI